MGTLRGKSTFVVGLVAVLVMGAVMPARAGYTKHYKFPNNTGVSQTAVKVTMNGLESVTEQYAYPRDWKPGTLGYAIASGVFCTTLTYGGSARAPNREVYIGWTTADGSCRLRDLRWGTGQSIIPTQVGGVPGGGMVFYDYPGPGCLTVVITNDTEGPIALSDVEFVIAGHELSLEELDDLLDVGFVELRVANIDEDIDALLADIVFHADELPSPSLTSLCKKMERAAAYKHDGLTEYLAGDLTRALFLWEKAAHQVENFISEVTNISEQGNLAQYLYERWVVHGDGEIAPAPEILEALLALPEGQALQSLEPLPCGELPAYPGLDPADCVQWPVGELNPGEFTAFVVCDVDLGSGFIMGGSVLDEDGNIVLEWLEQAVAEPAVLDTDAPVITSASVTPAYLWPPDHSIVNMTLDAVLEDDSYAVWYVAGVESNQPQDGTGDGDYAPDWGADPNDPQSLWLRAERSGSDPTGVREYTITLMAIDTAGNLSEPYGPDDDLVVRVDHDQG